VVARFQSPRKSRNFAQSSMISSVSPFASSSAVKFDSTLASVGLTTPHSKNKLATKDHTNPRTETDSVDERSK
jgi:hypothetical protein